MPIHGEAQPSEADSPYQQAFKRVENLRGKVNSFAGKRDEDIHNTLHEWARDVHDLAHCERPKNWNLGKRLEARNKLLALKSGLCLDLFNWFVKGNDWETAKLVRNRMHAIFDRKISIEQDSPAKWAACFGAVAPPAGAKKGNAAPSNQEITDDGIPREPDTIQTSNSSIDTALPPDDSGAEGWILVDGSETDPGSQLKKSANPTLSGAFTFISAADCAEASSALRENGTSGK